MLFAAGVDFFGETAALLGVESLATLAGDFLAGVTDFLFGVDWLAKMSGLDSSWMGTAADLLFNKGVAEVPGRDLLGVAPLFTGVFGGRFLSKCSGLSFGPKDTRLVK